MARAVTTLIPYYGSNRSLARHVGARLSDCSWAAVPFAGGMSELRHITARTILVGDLHRHVINLANVLKNEVDGPKLIRELRRMPFHEDTLRQSQHVCKARELAPNPDVFGYCYGEALAYFITAWMGRNGRAGTAGEFRSGLSVRYDGGGGDSAVRFRSAVEALRDWRKVMPRCTFVVRDCFDLLADVNDRPECGVYADPPFPDAGDKYRHNPGPSGSEAERAFHVRLRDALGRFERARVVARFYRHGMIEELYPTDRWEWLDLPGGKKQTNQTAPEVLIVSRQKAGN